MDDLTNKITLTRTELNLEQDPEKRQAITKSLNKLLLQKEIETMKKRMEQLSTSQ